MNSARRYYDLFHSLALPRLGSYLYVQQFTQDQAHQFHALNETYGKIVQKEIGEYVKNFNHGEIFVPSPWHAWALLAFLHSNFIRVDGQQWNTLDNFVVPAYRGHEDSNYQILPSLYRSNNQETEQRYLDIFTLIFNQPFLWQNLGIPLPLESAKAAAQHYGIHTDLLDITADPAIAVYFASHPESKNHAKTGAVLVFDLQNILSSGTKIILPPPPVDRLYKQQGAFLSFPNKDFHSIQNLIKITFPPNPDFQIIREGKHIDILETDHWFERAVNKSKEWIDQSNSLPIKQDEIDNFVLNIYKSIDYPAMICLEIALTPSVKKDLLIYSMLARATLYLNNCCWIFA